MKLNPNDLYVLRTLYERLKRVPWHQGATLDAFEVEALKRVLRDLKL